MQEPHDPQTGLSTRSGDLLRVDLTNIKPATAAAGGNPAYGAGTVYLTLFAYSVAAIREAGVSWLT